MRRLAKRFTPAALVVWIAVSGMPRALVVRHQHSGGEHTHVHVDAAGAAAHEPHAHGHVHHSHAPLPGDGLGTPDRGAEDHAHWQAPFQTGARPALPQLTVVATVTPHDLAPKRGGVEAPRGPARTRGPPTSFAG
jgi:hypothetical protein